MSAPTPCLWFDRNAEEAAAFYVSVFPNSRILTTTHYGEGMPLPAGTVLTIHFELDGREFMALNGGPLFSFSPAVSLAIPCETQAEVDHYWEKLTAGGAEDRCGWLKDRFGLSWQVVPTFLEAMFGGPDPAATARMNQALLTMKKLDLAALERAYRGE
jgi:predicted 3-demethylubiquinone-9 3-methyltransferase (glyoxalase superfamily)